MAEQNNGLHESPHAQRKSFKAPYARMRSDIQRLFFPWKTKEKRAHVTRAGCRCACLVD